MRIPSSTSIDLSRARARSRAYSLTLSHSLADVIAILDKFGGTSSKKKPADITIKRSNSNSQLPTTSNELTRSLDASPNNFNSDLTTATTTTTATPGTASADSTVARVPSANSSQSMPTVAAASSPPTTSAIAAAAAAATTTPMGAQSTDSDLTSSSSTPGVSSPLTDSDALSPSPVVPEQADASPPKRTRPLSEREKVLSELLHTERDYVRDLSILIEVFFQPCKERSILSQQDLTTLFNNLEVSLPRSCAARRVPYPHGANREVVVHRSCTTSTARSWPISSAVWRRSASVNLSH